MATLASETHTLLDYSRRLNPDGSIETDIVEMLSQSNEILTDMLWMQGNLETGHRVTMRTGLPTGTWRKLNQGVASSKSTTAQVDESCGMYFQRGQIDKDLAMLNGNTAAYRLSENVAHMEAMAQELAETILYGDTDTNPEKMLGLAPRFSTISGATNGQNILSGGGAGSDNTSVWLIGWGQKSCYGIFPKGSKAGVEHLVIKDSTGDGCTEVTDSDGYKYRAFVDQYSQKAGLCLKDWRYVVRIANIDVSNLVAESSAADLIKLMSRALDRFPTTAGIKPVFYMNRTVYSMLKIQALAKSNAALSVEEALGQFTVKFLGVPIRKVDAILNTEATIS